MDKTQPKSAAPSQPKSKPVPVASGSLRPFLLRKRNSTQVLRCPDLTTLRQWIVEKRLTRDDEVSRSGQKWRKMGTIVEFESLFYGVDQERLAKRKATAPDGAAVIPIGGAAAKANAPSASPAKAEAKSDVKADAKSAPKSDAKPEAAAQAEKPVLGPLKVTPPGLNQVSGNLSLMRLARPGSGKAKPAPTPPGLSGSAAAAKRAQDGGKAADGAAQAVPTAAMAGDSAPREVAKPGSKAAQKSASPTTSDSQTAVFSRPSPDAEPDSDVTRRMEPSDETRRIEPSDETRRIDRDPKVTAKTKPTDPIEEAIKKNDPVPRALQEARDVTQKIAASEPDEYELIERQAARRRNGILLLVAGGAALGLYYLLGSDQPTGNPQTGNPPGVEQKAGEPSGTQSKPVVEPLPTSNPPVATAPSATAPTATAPTATAPTATPPAAKPTPAVAPTAATPVGPAPGPTMAAKPTPPTATPTPTPAPTAAPTAAPTVAAAKPTPTVTPLPPTAAAKPPVAVTAPAPAPAVKPAAPPTPAPTPSPAVATAPPAAGAKITSDEVRRIIEQDIPKTFDGQIELANKFFERGKYEQSLAVYQLMMTYAPNVPAIHKALGDIAFERNQADQAIAHYNNALQIRPLYSAAEFGLAKTYHRLKNDKDQAIAHYVKYLEINPKGAAAGMCRDGITKLGGTPPPPPPPGP